MNFVAVIGMLSLYDLLRSFLLPVIRLLLPCSEPPRDGLTTDGGPVYESSSARAVSFFQPIARPRLEKSFLAGSRRMLGRQHQNVSEVPLHR